MDTSRLVEVAPHYGAMLVLAYLALGVAELTVGGLTFWLELVLVAGIVFAYRPVVMRLGVGPEAWDREE